MAISLTEAYDGRYERAEELVAAHAYVATAQSVFVYSDTPGVAGYSIDGETPCTCKDATVGRAHRMGIACKHEIAARLIRRDQAAGQRAAAATTLVEIAELFAR